MAGVLGACVTGGTSPVHGALQPADVRPRSLRDGS
jgi:hypothetical protein